jgi:hypothetical protein
MSNQQVARLQDREKNDFAKLQDLFSRAARLAITLVERQPRRQSILFTPKRWRNEWQPKGIEILIG